MAAEREAVRAADAAMPTQPVARAGARDRRLIADRRDLAITASRRGYHRAALGYAADAALLEAAARKGSALRTAKAILSHPAPAPAPKVRGSWRRIAPGRALDMIDRARTGRTRVNVTDSSPPMLARGIEILRRELAATA